MGWGGVGGQGVQGLGSGRGMMAGIRTVGRQGGGGGGGQEEQMKPYEKLRLP